MDRQCSDPWSRREVLGGLTLAGTAGLLGLGTEPVAAELPPETTTLRFVQTRSVCNAPQYVAEEFLRGEGFTEVQYRKEATAERNRSVASGAAHFTMAFAAGSVSRADAGDPIVLLAGVHVGCYELFGTDRVRAVRDLKGKTVAVPEVGAGQHLFLVSMLAYVGLDPLRDVNWIDRPPAEAMRLLAKGKIDAYLGFPPEHRGLCHGRAAREQERAGRERR